MEEVTRTVKRLASDADELSRRKLIDGLRDLSYSIETPNDTLERVAFLHLQPVAIRIGMDLKLFDLLAAASDPMTVEQLQRKTGAAPVLLGRLLRYLASIGTIIENRTDEFSSTNITKALAIPGLQAAANWTFETLGPDFQSFPGFLAKIKYQDVTDATNTPHQMAHETPLSAFEWLAEHPQNAAKFNEYMSYRREGEAACWDVYPVEQEAKGWDAQAPLLVDVGGGRGHQSAAFKTKFPKVPGRVIMEDLAGPISMALWTPGVENRVHNMFDPQPIKGAKFYYLKTVIHNWPDHKVREILQNIIPAMSAHSVILIDEMVLPDSGVNWHATSMDLTMMALLAAVERTRTQWAELLDSVGLKIKKVQIYSPSVYEGVITVVRQ